MNRIQALLQTINSCIGELMSLLRVRLTVEDVLIALVEETGDELDEIAERPWTCESLEELLRESKTVKLKPQILALAQFDESIIPEGTVRAIDEELIKHKGELWFIHGNDADPHPSNPHAHNYEANLKLHLGTGDLYKGTMLIGKLSRKDLLSLRDKVRYIELPRLEDSI